MAMTAWWLLRRRSAPLCWLVFILLGGRRGSAALLGGLRAAGSRPVAAWLWGIWVVSLGVLYLSPRGTGLPRIQCPAASGVLSFPESGDKAWDCCAVMVELLPGRYFVTPAPSVSTGGRRLRPWEQTVFGAATKVPDKAFALSVAAARLWPPLCRCWPRRVRDWDTKLLVPWEYGHWCWLLSFCLCCLSDVWKVGVRSRMARRSLRTLSCSQRHRRPTVSLASLSCRSCCCRRRSSRALTSRALRCWRASRAPPDSPARWLSWYRWLASLVRIMAARRPDSLTGWLTDWLAGWMTDWLTDWLAGWLTDWLTDSLTDWLTHWLTGWLTDWLTLGVFRPQPILCWLPETERVRSWEDRWR